MSDALLNLAPGKPDSILIELLDLMHSCLQTVRLTRQNNFCTRTSTESQILTIFWPLGHASGQKIMFKPRPSLPLACPPGGEAALAADLITA